MHDEIKMRPHEDLFYLQKVCRMAMETHPDDADVVRQARSALGLMGAKKAGAGVAPF